MTETTKPTPEEAYRLALVAAEAAYKEAGRAYRLALVAAAEAYLVAIQEADDAQAAE